MRKTQIASWSNILPTKTYLAQYKDGAILDIARGKNWIPRGAGRSFGDASYISEGITFVSEELNKILKLDKSRGLVTCQSGVLMRDLFRNINGSGWELPVVGGTGWITVGGAVATDIHSKNHEVAGTFGNHVTEIEVVTSSGLSVRCSMKKNKDLFSATIGGMGLTGIIKTVTIKLRKRRGNAILLTTKKFVGLDELFKLFERDKFEHKIGWIDFTTIVPRGIYYSGKNLEKNVPLKDKTIDFKPPSLKVFNKLTIPLFNSLRFSKAKEVTAVSDPTSFQWATDSIKHFNYLLGRSGFHEFQFIIPKKDAHLALYKFTECFRKHGIRPSFIVLKKFGTKKSPGLLSFPMEGYAVNPSFEKNPKNEEFFNEFTEYVISVGGRFNLCKDSTMTSSQFQKMYKNFKDWQKAVKKYDPKNHVQSDMSRRLKMKPW